MTGLRAAVLATFVASLLGCGHVGVPSARICGIAGFLLGGYTGAAGLRSIDTGTDWDSALTGGVLGAALLGGGGYFLCKWLNEDEFEAAQVGD